jgi:hypothetical protein
MMYIPDLKKNGYFRKGCCMKKAFIKALLSFGFFLVSGVPLFAQDPNFHLYLGFGQSNMSGAGAIETQDKTVDSRFQMMAPQDCSGLNRSIGKWYSAIPPLWGCPSGGLGPCDYFGRTMVKNLPATIKVGVLVIGIPGCDIRLFDKKNSQGLEAYTYDYIPAKYNKSAYAWLVDLAKLAQKDGVIKGFILHQGETMPDSTKWCGQVKAVYDSLIADLKLDPSHTPLLAGEMLYQNQGGSCGSHNTTVAKLPSVIPNSYVISASGITGKDVYHFDAAGERTFGARYAEKMLSLESSAIKEDNLTTPHQMLHPVTCKGGAVKIEVTGNFSYKITNLCGARIEAGNGTAALSAGTNLAPGIYFLSIEHKTGIFAEKIFKR